VTSDQLFLRQVPRTVKLDEEKSKYAGLAQENAFDLAA
jgi:hypothetical protein